METSDWIAALALFIAVLAVVVSAFSYAETKRTADANESMAESNRAMAHAAGESVSAARASADAARQSVDVQVAAWQEEKRAMLILVNWHFRWEMAEGGNEAALTIGLRNEGQWPAFGTTVGATFEPSGRYETNSSCIGTFDDEAMKFKDDYTPNVMHPKDVHLFRVRANRDDIGHRMRRFVDLHVNYRDGLGNHDHLIKLWLGGEWGPQGFNFSVVSSLVDGEPDLQQPNKPFPDGMMPDDQLDEE